MTKERDIAERDARESAEKETAERETDREREEKAFYSAEKVDRESQQSDTATARNMAESDIAE